MKISEDTHFKTDIKTVIMLIAGISVAVWTYSELNNRITSLETKNQLFRSRLIVTD